MSVRPPATLRPARLHRLAWKVVLAAAGLCTTPLALAQHKAHSHGTASLDVSIETSIITARLEAPLHDLIGFERAPRSPAEQERVAALSGRFAEPGQLLRIDPAAGCKPPRVALDAPVIGLQSANPVAGGPPAAKGHADLIAVFSFDCENAASARHLELGLFDAFKGIRVVNVRVVSDQRQYRRAIRASKPRMDWER
jgi:hypothetical protein